MNAHTHPLAYNSTSFCFLLSSFFFLLLSFFFFFFFFFLSTLWYIALWLMCSLRWKLRWSSCTSHAHSGACARSPHRRRARTGHCRVAAACCRTIAGKIIYIEIFYFFHIFWMKCLHMHIMTDQEQKIMFFMSYHITLLTWYFIPFL